MGALVEQHAAAFAFPGGAPAATGIVGFGAIPVSHDPTDAGHFAKLAVLQKAFELPVFWLGALLEHGGEYLLVIFMRRQQPLAIRFVDGNWLFDHHM